MCKYNHCPSCCDMFVLAEAWNIIRLKCTGVWVESWSWAERAGDLLTANKFPPCKQNNCATIIRCSAQWRGSGRVCVLPALLKEERECCSVLDKEAKVAFLCFCWIPLHEQPHLSKHDEKWKWNKGERGRNCEEMDWSNQALKTQICTVSDCSSFYSCWTY